MTFRKEMKTLENHNEQNKKIKITAKEGKGE